MWIVFTKNEEKLIGADLVPRLRGKELAQAAVQCPRPGCRARGLRLGVHSARQIDWVSDATGFHGTGNVERPGIVDARGREVFDIDVDCPQCGASGLVDLRRTGTG